MLARRLRHEHFPRARALRPSVAVGRPPIAATANLRSRRLGGRSLLLGRVRDCGHANPLALIVRLVSRCQSLAVAWPVTLHDAPEFVPVDWTKAPTLGLGVVAEIRIGQRELDGLRLR